jgi:hypothetical protein
VLTARKKEGIYIRCGLPGHSIPDYDYLPPKKLRLARGQAISPRSSVTRSSSSKKIRVSAAQVRTERIVQLRDELDDLEEQENTKQYSGTKYRKPDYKASERHPWD